MDSVINSKEYSRALDLVKDLFKDQKRKTSNVPYLVHLVGVSHTVAKATNDVEVVVAALLHDVLEDVSESVYSAEQMLSDFGDRVTELVKTVSHDEGRYGKIQSRQNYLEQIKYGPKEACLISAADLLSNSKDILELYQDKPDGIERDFGGISAVGRQWFWEQRFKILEERLGKDHVIIKELRPILGKMELVHQEIQ